VAFYFCGVPIDTYSNAVGYLYANLPMFQRVGASAYKRDLANTWALCEALGNPQKKFKTIHVAGTNGKGSTSHMLAAVLQTAGYKTGLYTSPHLKSFTERIRLNGQPVAEAFVLDFVNRIRPAIERVQPSFFEITVAMAFDYFAQQAVDVAVIEVGLGGRLDSTNVVTPLVSVITNISFDHMDLLGNTLPQIAFEKAGIIKQGIPCVVSQYQQEVAEVFREKGREKDSKLLFASDVYHVSPMAPGRWQVQHRFTGATDDYQLDLHGSYQGQNLAGVLVALELLTQAGFKISSAHQHHGLAHAAAITGIKGRWQKLGEQPLVIADTGHNEAGIRAVLQQIAQQKFEQLWIVLGMVKDKDVSNVLRLLPSEANYIFCQSQIPRALNAHELAHQATVFGLQGEVVPNVNAAFRLAKEKATTRDMIFIGGSTFVVAELENL
jgi:dihydrofolate synthase/folylpolyglutamate synthase